MQGGKCHVLGMTLKLILSFAGHIIVRRRTRHLLYSHRGSNGVQGSTQHHGETPRVARKPQAEVRRALRQPAIEICLYKQRQAYLTPKLTMLYVK